VADPLEPTRRLEVLALRLASFYEFYPNPFMDFFYSQLFEHFFHKGILEEMFAEVTPGVDRNRSTARKDFVRLQATFFEPRLRAAINWLLPLIRKYHHPLPDGYTNIQQV